MFILWIKDFLCDRPQHVFLNGFRSSQIVLKTGLSQGCVLSPILFSVYTNDITCTAEGMSLIKYAEDMALVAQITDLEALALTKGRSQIQFKLTSWIELNYEIMNFAQAL